MVQQFIMWDRRDRKWDNSSWLYHLMGEKWYKSSRFNHLSGDKWYSSAIFGFRVSGRSGIYDRKALAPYLSISLFPCFRLYRLVDLAVKAERDAQLDVGDFY